MEDSHEVSASTEHTTTRKKLNKTTLTIYMKENRNKYGWPFCFLYTWNGLSLNLQNQTTASHHFCLIKRAGVDRWPMQ